MNLQLTDDFNGKDLAEFSNVLAKSGIPISKYMCNEVNKDFLNIAITADDNYDDLTNSISTDYEVYLNDVELKLKDKNLSVFDYLAKLTKRIMSTPMTN